ncbi:MAG: S-layer homology domain-containing protein [Evtepia gabavorous]
MLRLYVTWAKETGIMNGVSADTLGVNSPLTRQQMAAALARYARYQGAQPGAFDVNTYSDKCLHCRPGPGGRG